MDQRYKNLTIKTLMTGSSISRERNILPMYKIQRQLEQDYQHLKQDIEVIQSKRTDRKSRIMIFSIPSEKFGKELTYTTAIEFFTEDDIIDENTKIRIATNEPAFQFTYAFLYYQAKLIIPNFEKLLNRISLATPPMQTNPKRIMGISKTLWFSIRFLQEKIGKNISNDIKEFNSQKIETADELVMKYQYLKKKYKPQNPKAFKF